MKRTFRSFPVNDFIQTKWQMLSWANQFNICCFLDNNEYQLPGRFFECMLAVDAETAISASAGNVFNALDDFLKVNNDWCFGHLSYDVKNEIESLQSNNPDNIEFPDLFFFVPRIIILLSRYSMNIGVISEDAEEVAKSVISWQIPPAAERCTCIIQSRFSREDYLQAIDFLRGHIIRGDCYEINFCQEFYALNTIIDPYHLYRLLNAESPNPFACFYKLNDKYLLCASPERFVRKSGEKLISQPIKGTKRRHLHNAEADNRNRQLLSNDPKEKSENIMIVDLVRNDLSKICREGSVVVDELMGIYGFPQVYQMISTVSGLVDTSVTPSEIFKAIFPMGSMTGAPKKRVMELIDMYERTKRGLFSGTVGYISPKRDMDFNVVIRSILFNAGNKYLSFQAGSAITYNSDPINEYEECLLKAAAIKKVLNG